MKKEKKENGRMENDEVPNRSNVATLIPLLAVFGTNQTIRVLLDELQGVLHELWVGFRVFQLTKKRRNKRKKIR